VATHLDDHPVLDAHELTHRNIQSAAIMLGDTLADGDDVLSAHR
jgi:hypothetical protein